MESGVTSALVLAGALVLSACSILFERTAHMAPTASNLVTKLSDVMKKNPNLKVPWSGTPITQANNLQPSQRRVKAMVDALVKDGVAADRLAAVGVGQLSPVAPNDRPEGRAQNRRVELVLIQLSLDSTLRQMNQLVREAL